MNSLCSPSSSFPRGENWFQLKSRTFLSVGKEDSSLNRTRVKSGSGRCLLRFRSSCLDPPHPYGEDDEGGLARVSPKDGCQTIIENDA